MNISCWLGKHKGLEWGQLYVRCHACRKVWAVYRGPENPRTEPPMVMSWKMPLPEARARHIWELGPDKL